MKHARLRAWMVWGALAVAVACSRDAHPPATVGEAKATARPTGTIMDAERAMQRRAEALAAARVWNAPPVPVRQANLRDNPEGPGSVRADQDIDCRFTTHEVSGTTPKFYCELPGGEVVKVKYGTGNPELRAEVAA